jgi:hypothetical protein
MFVYTLQLYNSESDIHVLDLAHYGFPTLMYKTLM